MTYLIKATMLKMAAHLCIGNIIQTKKLTKKECLKILFADKHPKLKNFSCREIEKINNT